MDLDSLEPCTHSRRKLGLLLAPDTLNVKQLPILCASSNEICSTVAAAFLGISGEQTMFVVFVGCSELSVA